MRYVLIVAPALIAGAVLGLRLLCRFVSRFIKDL